MTTAYQKSAIAYAPPRVQVPPSSIPGSGCQQAADSAVVGRDAATTPAVDYQPVGLPVVPAAYTQFDGNVP